MMPGQLDGRGRLARVWIAVPSPAGGASIHRKMGEPACLRRFRLCRLAFVGLFPATLAFAMEMEPESIGMLP